MSASSGPSSVVTTPAVSVNGISTHALPVLRRRSITVERPPAFTVSFSDEPRNRRLGTSASSILGSSAPFHASTGCASARQPSVERAATSEPMSTAGTMTAAARIALRARRCSSAGASGDGIGASVSASRSAARFTNTVLFSASSTMPRTDPSRSFCSRSMAPAIATDDASSRTACEPRRSIQAASATAAPQMRNGTGLGSTIHRDPPSANAPSESTASTAAIARADTAARSSRSARERSRSTIARRVMTRAGS